MLISFGDSGVAKVMFKHTCLTIAVADGYINFCSEGHIGVRV